MSWHDYYDPYYGDVKCNLTKENTTRCLYCNILIYNIYLDAHLKSHAHEGQGRAWDPFPNPITTPPVQSKPIQRTSRTGRRTISDIVENVAYIGDNRELYQAITGDSSQNRGVSYGASYSLGYDEYPYKSYDYHAGFPKYTDNTSAPINKANKVGDTEYFKSEPVELNGWLIHKEPVQMGRKKALRTHMFTSENMEVFVIKIIPFGFDLDYCIFSPSREAVMSFLKDFDIQVEIEDMDSVCQSI